MPNSYFIAPKQLLSRLGKYYRRCEWTAADFKEFLTDSYGARAMTVGLTSAELREVYKDLLHLNNFQRWKRTRIQPA